MKICLTGLALILAAAPASAHDFWIQPRRFQVKQNVPLPFTLQVGHGQFRQRWGSENSRILLLGDFFPNLRRDLRPDLRDGGAADLLTSFPVAGLHIVALQSSHAYSELPSIRFNDYAKSEGLVIPLAVRQRTGTMGSVGREKYSRRAKALIQVGQQTSANQSMATRPIGLKLEIVPDRNPYALGPSRMLPVHVIYKGRRLPNATVMMTSLEFDSRPLATVVTDRAGRANFKVPAVGDWLLNVLWSEPVTGDPRADFDTTFSSLTFGYDPAQKPR